MAATPQPSGTVTLVFTDIEGSTRLLDLLGPEGYRTALGDHRRIVRDSFRRHDGYEVDTAAEARRGTPTLDRALELLDESDL